MSSDGKNENKDKQTDLKLSQKSENQEPEDTELISIKPSTSKVIIFMSDSSNTNLHGIHLDLNNKNILIISIDCKLKIQFKIQTRMVFALLYMFWKINKRNY